MHLRRTVAAAFAVAFSGFLRVGEFTYTASDLNRKDFHLRFLTRSSVSFSPTGDSVRIFLPYSKADPNRKGMPIILARSDDIFCPVKTLADYLHCVPALNGLPDRQAPLFYVPENLQGHGSPFTRGHVLRILIALLTHAGINPEGYNTHSFRRGAATWAELQGIPADRIQKLGRWKSDAYKAYIDTPDTQLFAFSRQLHGAVDPLSSLPSIITPEGTLSEGARPFQPLAGFLEYLQRAEPAL